MKFGDKTNKMSLFENPLSGNTELVIELRVVSSAVVNLTENTK